jgi:hypothetical protein
VVLVNGATGVVYKTVDLPNVNLAAGDYYVLCANNVTVANCDLDLTPDTNLIQNGDPDAVGLLFGVTLVDVVSYGGDTAAPYTEGSGGGLVDSSTAGLGISRCPDGFDTNVNNVDFYGSRPITPGEANSCPPPPLDVPIREIQGVAHRSPLEGQSVATEGIVTAVRSNGFNMQDPDPDSNDATSEDLRLHRRRPHGERR